MTKQIPGAHVDGELNKSRDIKETRCAGVPCKATGVHGAVTCGRARRVIKRPST